MRNIVISLFVLLMAIPLTAKKATFNDGWEFRISETQEWEPVNIPHTWNTDAYSIKNYHKGKAYYRKSFLLNLTDSIRKIFLRFEGVSKKADIRINGKDAGHHEGGYTSFALDITPFVKFGSSNDIEIDVDNNCNDIPPVSGDFTFFGGIYRDIWIEDYDALHFALNPFATPGIKVTPTFEYGLGKVTVDAKIDNSGKQPTNATVRFNLYDPQGNLIDTADKKVKIGSGSVLDLNHTFQYILNPELWSPDSPDLYSVETLILNKNGKALDYRNVKTGIRSFHFDENGAFYLNGKPLKLRGVCRHQDMMPYGPALNDETHRRDIELAKDMGANFIRISHYPQDPAILEMTDRLGLLVWEEIPVIDFVPDNKKYARNCDIALREMISQHYNHPSVIMWGYMNEILLKVPGDDTAEGKETVDRTKSLITKLESVCRTLDPTRMTTMAFHGSDRYRTSGISQFPMINGWNLYQGWYGSDLSDFERFLSKEWNANKEKPVIVSEYGAGSDRRLHSLSPKPFDFSIEYQQKYLEHYLPVIEDSTFVAGATYWNLVDFSSAQREESMPRINNKGLLYSDRTPKDVYHYLKASWRDDIDYVYIASRDWNDRTVVTDSAFVVTPIKIYANTPSVSLIVNGNHIGAKDVIGRIAIFDAPLGIGNNSIIARGGNWVDAYNIDIKSIHEHFTADNIEGVELAVNVGSNCSYTSPVSKLTWVEDREYKPGSWGRTGGTDKSYTSEIKGTSDNPLFQTEARDLKGYRFDVPDGEYELELGFADNSVNGPGLAYLLDRKDSDKNESSSFAIKVNGNLIEPSFTPAQGNGYSFATVKKYIVDSVNNTLDIEFVPISGKPFLNSIKLRKL